MVVVVVAAAVPSKIRMIVTSTYYSLVGMWMEEPNVMIVAAAFCILVEYFCLPKKHVPSTTFDVETEKNRSRQSPQGESLDRYPQSLLMRC